MSAQPLEARVAPARPAFARRLAQKAAALAEARAELNAREDSGRWRLARLLWPLFTKGS